MHGEISESLVHPALPSAGQNSDVSLLSHFTHLCLPSALTARFIDELHLLPQTQPVSWVRSEQAEIQLTMGVSLSWGWIFFSCTPPRLGMMFNNLWLLPASHDPVCSSMFPCQFLFCCLFGQLLISRLPLGYGPQPSLYADLTFLSFRH